MMKQYQTNTTRLIVSIPEELAQKIAGISRKDGVGLSQIVALALTNFLEQQDSPLAERISKIEQKLQELELEIAFNLDEIWEDI